MEKGEDWLPYITWLNFYEKLGGNFEADKLASISRLIINQRILDESLDRRLDSGLKGIQDDFNGYFYSPPYVGYIGIGRSRPEVRDGSAYWKLGPDGYGPRNWESGRLEWGHPRFYDITSLVLRSHITSLNFPRGV